MIKNYNFIEKYEKEFRNLIKLNEKEKKNLLRFYKYVLSIKNKNKKIIIAGNGGSAAISSHFSVDMTKIGGVRCVNFNESDLLTCFSNDYGYENWLSQAMRFYLDKKDLVILISSSGNSKNIINAANYVKKNKNILITFSGFNGKNKLFNKGDINFSVDSKNYNLIENTHQFWLLMLVDMIKNNNK